MPCTFQSTYNCCMFSVTRLTKQFGDKRILDEVSLELRPGTVYALVGPNGSGKSTLLRILWGELAADSGTFTYQGAAVDPRRPIQPRRPLRYRNHVSWRRRRCTDRGISMPANSPSVPLPVCGLAIPRRIAVTTRGRSRFPVPDSAGKHRCQAHRTKPGRKGCTKSL